MAGSETSSSKGGSSAGGDAGRRTWIALLRIYIGICFIYFSSDKLAQSYFNGMAGTLRDFASSCQYPWYKDFLIDFAIPNAKLFAFLTCSGELLVGIALVLGFITGLTSMIGIILNLNYYWATSGIDSSSVHFMNLTFIACQLVFIFTCAGRTLGVDKFLAKKILFKYLL